MRISLSHALFQDGKVDPADLLQLVLACRRPSAHFIVLNHVLRPGTDSPIHRWMSLWPQSVQKTLRGILSDTTESARRGRALTIVVQSERSDWDSDPLSPQGEGLRLNVKDALAMVRMPLHVLVENRRNDGRFVARFAIMLDKTNRALFRDALRFGWLVFEQGGGLQEVQHLLEDLHSKNHDPVLCPNGTQRDVRRWRLFVVIDHDALAIKRLSGDPTKVREAKPRDVSVPSDESLRVQQTAKNALHEWKGRPAIHQLRRRAIENYIPLRSLAKWSEETSEKLVRYEAFRVLDAAGDNGKRSRWHFNMKKGLGGDKPNGLEIVATSDEHVHPMFHALTEMQRVALQDGFGSKVADVLFDRDVTTDECLHEELSLDDVEATNLLHNLLNRL